MAVLADMVPVAERLDLVNGVPMDAPHSHSEALAAMTARYRPEACKEGWNTTADGERFYFIPTPSAGLWATREKLYGRGDG